jgi:peroxiredoxin
MWPLATAHKVCQSRRTRLVLKAGQPAPDFTLKSHDGRMIRLSDYRGKQNVVIAFFPLAWTPV